MEVVRVFLDAWNDRAAQDARWDRPGRIEIEVLDLVLEHRRLRIGLAHLDELIPDRFAVPEPVDLEAGDVGDDELAFPLEHVEIPTLAFEVHPDLVDALFNRDIQFP